MAYQLDHRSQGTNAHASVPAWSTTASSVWSVEFEIEVFALSSTIALGGATYTARVAQITTAGTVTCQNSGGGTVLTSAAGAVTVGVNTIKVERTSGGLWQLTVNGVSVSTSSTAAAAPMTYLANRVQNSYTNTNIAIRRVATSGGAYSTVWDGTNAPSTGTTWTSSSGQVATLNNFTGVTDSWWVFYNSITTTGIPNNTLGAALNQACTINLNNYFTGATSYSVLSGSLPTGLSIVGNVIVGTPTTAQSTTLVIRASNSIDTLDSATITFNTGLWYLQQAGSAGYLQTSEGLSFVSGDNWVFRFALQQASNALFRVFGEPSTTQSRIFINPTGLLLRLEFSAGGSYVDFTLPSGFSIATKRDFVLAKSGSSYTLNIDGGAPIVGALSGSNRTWGSASTAFFRSSNTTMSDGALYYFEFEKNGVIQNSYDANTSGGVGTLLIDRVNKNNAAQAGTWPADNAEWVSYAPAGGDSFAGTIGKTSLSILTKSLSTQLGLVIGGVKSSNILSNKTIDVSSGYSSTVDKSTSTISQKQFSVSVGMVLGVGKQTLVVSNRQESTQLGYVNTLSKLGYTLATKQLSVVVGTNLPFIGVLNKTTYSLSGKQLDIIAGWNSGLNIQSLNVEGKQESVNVGYVVDINELSIPVIGKPFSIQTGTSISFVGELSKSDLNLVGKPLSVDAGTVIPFIGFLGKTSLSLSGKALSRLHGQILDIQKQSVSLVTKQLSVGEVVYPIIPIERLFTFTDKGRTYLFKQTTNVYLLTNRNNTYLIKGK